jgi:hypothetical protein
MHIQIMCRLKRIAFIRESSSVAGTPSTDTPNLPLHRGGVTTSSNADTEVGGVDSKDGGICGDPTVASAAAIGICEVVWVSKREVAPTDCFL